MEYKKENKKMNKRKGINPTCFLIAVIILMQIRQMKAKEEIEYLEKEVNNLQEYCVSIHEACTEHEKFINSLILKKYEPRINEPVENIEREKIPMIERIFYKAEIELLCQLVEAEAGGCTKEQKKNVAFVVFNRLSDERYPSTIEEVILQKNQFSTVTNGVIFDKVPSGETIQAVYEAFEEAGEKENIIFFETLNSNVHQAYAKEVFCDGAHKFYR